MNATIDDMKASRRAYNTAWARRKRLAAIDAKNLQTLRCTAMLGNRKPCKTPLQSRFVDGVTVPFCVTCDRKARRVCIDCGQPNVGGKALRCALHHKLAKQAALTKYKETHQAKLRRKERRRMADPLKHADRLEYKRLYRKTRPSKVAQYKKEYAKRNAEKVKAYHAAYRAARAAERRERERLRNAGQLPARSCLSCPTVITGRAKKCDACKRSERQAARAAISARLECAA